MVALIKKISWFTCVGIVIMGCLIALLRISTLLSGFSIAVTDETFTAFPRRVADDSLIEDNALLCGGLRHGVWLVPQAKLCLGPQKDAIVVTINPEKLLIDLTFPCKECDPLLLTAIPDSGRIVHIKGLLVTKWMAIELRFKNNRPDGFGFGNSAVGYARRIIQLEQLIAPPDELIRR